MEQENRVVFLTTIFLTAERNQDEVTPRRSSCVWRPTPAQPRRMDRFSEVKL